jgi:hypothetical protein
MDRKVLREDQWKRIEPLCSGKASECEVTGCDNRLFVEEGVVDRPHGLTVARPAQALWSVVHGVHVFFPLGKKCVWARMTEVLKRDADLEPLFIDSTIVRAHQHATGTQKNGRSSHQMEPGWAEHQNSCGSRSVGQSLARASDRQANGRHDRSGGPHQGT